MAAKKKARRILLGTGYLGIAGSCGVRKSGLTIPTAYGIWIPTHGTWRQLRGCAAAVDKKVRLIAEIL